MDEEAETKAIEKWLRMVDKPLATKEGNKKPRRKKTSKNNKAIFAIAGSVSLSGVGVRLAPL